MKNQKFTDLLTGIPRLIRVPLVVLGMVCVFVGGVIDGFEYLNEELTLAIFTVFFITSGSMAFNDYFDREIDKEVHPERPIPSGKITPFQALVVSILFFSISLLLSLFINLLCLIIAVITIDLLVLYETIFKNQGLVGNLMVSFIVGISFTFGGASVGKAEMSIDFSLIAFFLILGREILMDVTDIEGDRLNRYTLPMKIGRKKTTIIGCISLLISAFFLLIPGFIGIFPRFYLILILPVIGLLLYSIIISLKNIENTGRTADLLIIIMGLGLPVFVFSILF